MNDKSLFMDKNLPNLIHVLEKEVENYRLLLTALRKEKDAVLCSSIEKLNAAASEKDSLILKIGFLEKRRLKSLHKLATYLNCPPETIRLKRLAKMVPQPYSYRLNIIYRNLVEITKQIGKMNRSNENLMTHALNVTKESITFLYNLIVSHSTYYPTGKMYSKKRNGLLMSETI